MRIAFVEEQLNICGGNRRIIEVSNRLVKKGHDVDIILVLDDKPLACDWLEVKSNIIHMADRRDYDVAIMNHAPTWYALEKLAARLKVYYWLNFEGAYYRKQTWYDAYQQDYYIIALSNWVADCAEMIYGKRPPVVYGGVDKKLFHQVKVPKEYEIVSIVTQSRPEKGWFYVKRLIELTGLSWYNIQNIPQKDMAEAYSKGKIFVGMPECEGWYQPALEAMACGVPVILTNACGNMDYAEDGKNCILIPRNVGAAWQAVKKLRQDKSLYNKLKKNGLETVKKYTWDKCADEFEKVITKAYKEVIWK